MTDSRYHHHPPPPPPCVRHGHGTDPPHPSFPSLSPPHHPHHHGNHPHGPPHHGFPVHHPHARHSSHGHYFLHHHQHQQHHLHQHHHPHQYQQYCPRQLDPHQHHPHQQRHQHYQLQHHPHQHHYPHQHHHTHQHHHSQPHNQHHPHQYLPHQHHPHQHPHNPHQQNPHRCPPHDRLGQSPARPSPVWGLPPQHPPSPLPPHPCLPLTPPPCPPDPPPPPRLYPPPFQPHHQAPPLLPSPKCPAGRLCSMESKASHHTGRESPEPAYPDSYTADGQTSASTFTEPPPPHTLNLSQGDASRPVTHQDVDNISQQQPDRFRNPDQEASSSPAAHQDDQEDRSASSSDVGRAPSVSEQSRSAASSDPVASVRETLSMVTIQDHAESQLNASLIPDANSSESANGRIRETNSQRKKKQLSSASYDQIPSVESALKSVTIENLAESQLSSFSTAEHANKSRRRINSKRRRKKRKEEEEEGEEEERETEIWGPGNLELEKQRARKLCEREMKEETRKMFPDLFNTTLHLPPQRFNKMSVKFDKERDLFVHHVSDTSDISCARAEDDVRRCLETIRDVTGEVMCVIFNYSFDSYLEKKDPLPSRNGMWCQSVQRVSLSHARGRDEVDPSTALTTTDVSFLGDGIIPKVPQSQSIQAKCSSEQRRTRRRKKSPESSTGEQTTSAEVLGPAWTSNCQQASSRVYENPALQDSQPQQASSRTFETPQDLGAEGASTRTFESKAGQDSRAEQASRRTSESDARQDSQPHGASPTTSESKERESEEQEGSQPHGPSTKTSESEDRDDSQRQQATTRTSSSLCPKSFKQTDSPNSSENVNRLPVGVSSDPPKPFLTPKSLFPSPEDLDTELKRGDFDVLIISPRHGCVVMETKAVGYKKDPDEATLKKKVQLAVDQLRKQARVLRFLFKDLVGELSVRTVLVLPNVRRCQMRDLCFQDPSFAETLSSCCGTRCTEQALATVLTADDLPPTPPPHFPPSHVPSHHALLRWWLHVTKGSHSGISADDSSGKGVEQEREELLEKSVCQRMISRLAGPYSRVTVENTRRAAEARTVAECIHLTGLRYGRALLRRDQLPVLDCTEPFVYLTGPPGSGKTLVLGLKGLHWASQGDHVVVLVPRGVSWGNLVSLTLYQRIKQYAKLTPSVQHHQDSSKTESHKQHTSVHKETVSQTPSSEQATTPNSKHLSVYEETVFYTPSSEHVTTPTNNSPKEEDSPDRCPSTNEAKPYPEKQNVPQQKASSVNNAVDLLPSIHTATVENVEDTERFVQELLCRYSNRPLRVLVDEGPTKVDVNYLHRLLSHVLEALVQGVHLVRRLQGRERGGGDSLSSGDMELERKTGQGNSLDLERERGEEDGLSSDNLDLERQRGGDSLSKEDMDSKRKTGEEDGLSSDDLDLEREKGEGDGLSSDDLGLERERREGDSLSRDGLDLDRWSEILASLSKASQKNLREVEAQMRKVQHHLQTIEERLHVFQPSQGIPVFTQTEHWKHLISSIKDSQARIAAFVHSLHSQLTALLSHPRTSEGLGEQRRDVSKPSEDVSRSSSTETILRKAQSSGDTCKLSKPKPAKDVAGVFRSAKDIANSSPIEEDDPNATEDRLNKTGFKEGVPNMWKTEGPAEQDSDSTKPSEDVSNNSAESILRNMQSSGDTCKRSKSKSFTPAREVAGIFRPAKDMAKSSSPIEDDDLATTEDRLNNTGFKESVPDMWKTEVTSFLSLAEDGVSDCIPSVSGFLEANQKSCPEMSETQQLSSEQTEAITLPPEREFEIPHTSQSARAANSKVVDGEDCLQHSSQHQKNCPQNQENGHSRVSLNADDARHTGPELETPHTETLHSLDEVLKALYQLEAGMLEASGKLFNVETHMDLVIINDIMSLLVKERGRQDLSVWSSGMTPFYEHHHQASDFVLKTLNHCLRCPPTVQHVLGMVEKDFNNSPNYMYTTSSLQDPDFPLPTNGPEVHRLSHASHVTQVKDILDCWDCGHALADYLINTLHIDQEGCVKMEDVAISGSLDICDVSGRPYFMALTRRGIQLWLQSHQLTSPPPPHPGLVCVIGGTAFQGLENKVVVFIPDVIRISYVTSDVTEFRPELPDWLRTMGRWNRCHLWFVASRCLSQLVVFHV